MLRRHEPACLAPTLAAGLTLGGGPRSLPACWELPAPYGEYIDHSVFALLNWSVH